MQRKDTFDTDPLTIKFNEEMLGWTVSGSEMSAGGERVNGIPIDAFFQYRDSAGKLTENMWQPKTP